jgi:peptidoglycan glycosyltransferase
MKKALMIISLILMGCAHQNIVDNKSFAETCHTETNICKKNYSVLAEEIEKFNAAGGAFILVNLENNEVLNSVSISNLKDFNYNQDYSYTPNNIMKLLKKDKTATTKQFIKDYATFIKSAPKEDLNELRDNVTTGTAHKINIEGINIYGLTATDYKLDNPDDVITTFLGHFTYQNQEYAFITLLDSPKGIKSTYGFNSSGWNATKLARKIVESVILNTNLTAASL